MKRRKAILFLDAVINILLGVLLLAYSSRLANFLGVPVVESSFYPNILGGVLIGIGLALMIESFAMKINVTSGLGLIGAISINLCGGIVLFFWLVPGNLDLPLRGLIFLWSLDILLLLISSLELIHHLSMKDRK